MQLQDEKYSWLKFERRHRHRRFYSIGNIIKYLNIVILCIYKIYTLQTRLTATTILMGESLSFYAKSFAPYFTRPYHQLTRTHKVLEAKQHGITVSSSFEIQPVFLHSSSLFCHTLWLLKLKDPKELVLRAIQGRGAQYYWM